jgi:hypothetical protein
MVYTLNLNEIKEAIRRYAESLNRAMINVKEKYDQSIMLNKLGENMKNKNQSQSGAKYTDEEMKGVWNKYVNAQLRAKIYMIQWKRMRQENLRLRETENEINKKTD